MVIRHHLNKGRRSDTWAGVTVCSVGWLVLFAFVKQALVKFFAKILQRRVGMGAEKGSEA